MNETAKTRFLASLSKKGNVTLAAAAARISRETAYATRKADPAFMAAWDVALEEAGDYLEEEARRRAVDGTLKPVFQGGAEVGKIRVYSDALLVLLLKAAKPQKFVERRELSGANGGPIVITNDVNELRKLDPSELVRLHRETLGDTE